MCALVHVILTCQLAHWQHNKGYHASFENPPAARSWPLDIVNDTMAAVGAKKYKTDSCSWGHVDPMSGKPVNKTAVCGIHRQPIQFGAAMQLLPRSRSVPVRHP